NGWNARDCGERGGGKHLLQSGHGSSPWLVDCFPGIADGRKFQARASRIMLKGVSVARRKRLKPPALATSRNLASPAWAPSARPTSWSSDVGVQTMVEPA